MDGIKISVVIPVYNMEQYIKACLDNVLAQTLKEIEVICINDGSTDKSVEILKEYEKKCRNVLVILQKRQGAGPARNTAISRAKGKYIAFMDADDYYPERDVLETLYTYAETEGMSICGGSLIYEKDDHKMKDDTSKSRFTYTGLVEYKEYQYALGYQRFIFRTDFLRENGISFPAYWRFQDPPFMAHAMMCAGSFYAVALDVYVYRKFDRIQLFDNFEVLNDFVRGIGDVLKTSVNGHFEKLHGDMVNTLLAQRENFYKSIYKGNTELPELLNKILSYMDEELLREDGRFKEKPLLKTTDKIKEHVDRIYEEEGRLWEEINKFHALVIYGAGITGKCLFEYLKEKGYEGTISFGVTAPKCDEIICGKRVHGLKAYAMEQQKILVIVAASKENIPVMLDYAKEQGFENVVSIQLESITLFRKYI